MAENKNVNNIDDFDLPPLPSLPKLPKMPVKEGGAPAVTKQQADMGKDDDFELPSIPESVKAARRAELEEREPTPVPAPKPEIKKEKPSSIDMGDDFDLPPIPEEVKAARRAELEEREPTPVPAPKPEIKKEKPSSINMGNDFDLPPIPEAVKEARKAELEESSPAPVPAPKKEEPVREALDDNYAVDDAEPIDYDNMDEEALKALQKSMAPMRTKKEVDKRNARENSKMQELSEELGSVPVLDDLSDEYTAPQKKAETLIDRDYLEADEKQMLKQRLEEDLGRRPENFNARASKKMYNKLMEEKKLKIAKKGFGLSFIVIIMGLIAAGICYFKMNWENHEWFEYVAYFGVASSLLLLIKSVHTKLFSVIISAMTLIMYVGPGLLLYSVKMQGAPDYIVHIVCGVLASALNIASIIMLTKNEAIKTYYSSEFSRKE